MELVMKKMKEKIKKNITYYLSYLNESDLNTVRKFAKKNDACDSQYDNFINLLKYHSKLECWQFILGNFSWLEINDFADFSKRYVLYRADYKSMEYNKDLTVFREINYYIDGNMKTYATYDKKGQLSILRRYKEYGVLYEEFSYYYDFYDRPKLNSKILKDDLYHIVNYDYKGNKKREYTTDLNNYYHGKYIVYYDESDIINKIINHEHGKMHGADEEYTMGGKLMYRNMYINGKLVVTDQAIINSYLFDK